MYVIKYEEYPGFYRIGFVADRFFYERLKDHAKATGLTPIVVLAFEQTSNWTKYHPEQIEYDLQSAVARDLVETGFLEKFDLDYVRECGDYGFQYNGSEADITRVCLYNSEKFLINSFSPLNTGIVLGGNKQVREAFKNS